MSVIDADGLLAVPEHRGVDEVGDRLGVERGVPAGEHDRVRLVAVRRVQRDAGEVERGEQVGVAELGREADAEHVESGHRPVSVDGELTDAVLAHQRLEVGPHRVGALGERVRALVEHLVEDLDALVRQADLVGVGVHQRPVDGDGVPLLGARVQLAADVLDRLGDARQQRLEATETTLDRHAFRVYGAARGDSEPPGASDSACPCRYSQLRKNGARFAVRHPRRVAGEPPDPGVAVAVRVRASPA